MIMYIRFNYNFCSSYKIWDFVNVTFWKLSILRISLALYKHLSQIESFFNLKQNCSLLLQNDAHTTKLNEKLGDKELELICIRPYIESIKKKREEEFRTKRVKILK